MTKLDPYIERAIARSQPKYRNRKTVVDGITFASAKEARRYGELKVLERAGQIAGLKIQPAFPLDVKGTPICRYVADFEYIAPGDVRVVEDVKSPITRKHPVYRIKAKLFEAIHGFKITEV